MNNFELQPEKKNEPNIANIDAMPEETLGQMEAKHQAYNDLIIDLGEKIRRVSIESESGSNSPDDESQEQAQDEQSLDLIGGAMDHARAEMANLGEKIRKFKQAA